MFQSRTLPAIPFADRLRTGAGRRALGLGAALFIEALLVLLLLTLGSARRTEEEQKHLVSFDVREASEEPPAAHRSEPEAQRTETRPQLRQPQPEQEPNPQQPADAPPAPPSPVAPPAPAIVPSTWNLTPGVPRPPTAAATPTYGPVNRPSVMAQDTERVGTAPNGQPMYAAAWYREPDHAMMRAYLSSAHGPGWGLIACRTAPDFRVEDCVALDEYPEGSQITRSALAAAWEFRVRPPRRGGQVLVGAWVRIRISYN